MSGCSYFSEHSRLGMNSQSHSHFLRLWFSGWLQSCDCVFPVLHYGKLLLAASRRSVSSCFVGRLLLLREEVLLVVHSDWLGYVSYVQLFLFKYVFVNLWHNDYVREPCKTAAADVLTEIHSHFTSLQEVQRFSSWLGALPKLTSMMSGKINASVKASNCFM